MINSLAPSENPVGTSVTSAIRSSSFSIRWHGWAEQTSTCSPRCSKGSTRIQDRLSSEQGWGCVGCHLQCYHPCPPAQMGFWKETRQVGLLWPCSGCGLVRGYSSCRDCRELLLLPLSVAPIQSHKIMNSPSAKVEQSILARLTSYNSHKNCSCKYFTIRLFFLLLCF